MLHTIKGWSAHNISKLGTIAAIEADGEDYCWTDTFVYKTLIIMSELQAFLTGFGRVKVEWANQQCTPFWLIVLHQWRI